ncbi:MAG: cytochrome c biogenesis protein CcsA [Pyrinomonadaceae bacterium]
MMRPLLLAALAGYVVAAIHSVLAFINKRRSLARISLAALAFGFVTHTSSLIVDWLQEGHYPLFQLRDTLSFLAWTLVIAYCLALYRYKAQALGVFTLPLVALLTLNANIMADAAPSGAASVTSGDVAWILMPVHTTLLIFAYACFFVVFVAGVMYLLQERELKLKTFSAIFHRLPSLTTVDDIGSTAAYIGFTLLTLGILSGMIWSSARVGRIWQYDPKEIFAALTWLLYLALLHYRYTARWRGRKAAWVGVVGFMLVLCTFLGTRLMGGYHVFG